MTTVASTISERSDAIVEEFGHFDDWLGRYEYLIELGKDLPLIDEEYKTDAFRASTGTVGRTAVLQGRLRRADHEGADCAAGSCP